MRYLIPGLAALLCLTPHAAAEPTLVGFASLPADTFEEGGHTSGQFIEEAELNGRTPPFETQPIQGISSIVAGDTPGTFLALSDNGYGAKANSADYLLSVYRVTPTFKTEQGGSGDVAIDLAFRLSDPDKHVPWPIVADAETYPNSDIAVPAPVREKRLLTGADFDVESMVRLPDGTFWIGDEFGPFLLHVDAEGRLLKSPQTAIGQETILQSPDRPTKLDWKVNVERNAGFAAMVPGFNWLAYAFLEKPLQGDAGVVRVQADVNDFDPPLFGPARVPLIPGTVAMGGADVLRPGGHLIAVLRDDGEAKAAKRKVIAFYRSMGNDLDAPGVQFPQRVGGPRDPVVIADLLNLPDPHDLDGDGKHTFRFPFLTPESVVVVDERTVLVVNDNNYPFTSGRTEGEPDPTEFILIRFDKPLAELP